MRRLRFCLVCKVWWPRRRRRQWCPCCHELLVDKELPAPAREVRPGVVPQWSEP
jgi:hypothetical protein